MTAEAKLIRKLERRLELVKTKLNKRNELTLKKFRAFKKKATLLKNRAGKLIIDVFELYNNNDPHNRYSLYRANFRVEYNKRRLNHSNILRDDIIHDFVDRSHVIMTEYVDDPFTLYMYGVCLSEQLFLKYTDGSYVMHESKSGDLKEFVDANKPQ